MILLFSVLIQHSATGYFEQMRAIGLDGLSFDTVPNCKVASVLMQIAQGVYETKLDATDFYSNQIILNRAWKLLVIGIAQAESVARYLAMIALRRAVPLVKETLMDDETRTVSDFFPFYFQKKMLKTTSQILANGSAVNSCHDIR
jgi:hypothetical protein